MRHDGEELLDELEVRLVVAEVDLCEDNQQLICAWRASERTCPWTRVPTCSCAALVTLGWQWPRLVTPTVAHNLVSYIPVLWEPWVNALPQVKSRMVLPHSVLM